MVYLHVPFCRSFCTYCDFYSEIACRDRDAQQFEAYTEAVCAEAARRRDEIEATRGLNTLYIGGGTPSVLPLSYLERIVHSLAVGSSLVPVGQKKTSSLRCGNARQGQPAARPPQSISFTEFTVEVNPEDIVEKGEDYVRGLLALGVNRVSMGVQSLDDGILRWMNRRHDAARARQAYRILRDAGVDNISIDLIFGLSQLSEPVFAETLEEIVHWRPEHISAYQLSIEEGSALGEMVRKGRYEEASQEQCAAQYRLLCDTLQAAGYVHYEISNWALPGFEAVHNSAYWARLPYVGLGPGAHSFQDHTRSWNEYSLRSYLSNPHRCAEPPMKGASPSTSVSGGDSVASTSLGSLADTPSRRLKAPSLRSKSGQPAACAGGSETLSDEEAREEKIFLGLRTARGIPEGLLDAAQAAQMLADGRLARTAEGRLRIPEDHWFVSDDIIADLI